MALQKPHKEERFEAFLNRRIMGNWLAALLVAALLEWAMIAYGPASLIDWLLLFCFLGLGAVLAIQFADHRPVLIISAAGILDRRLYRQTIPWESLTWYKLYPEGKFPLLAIGLGAKTRLKAGFYPWSGLFKNQPNPYGSGERGYCIWPRRTYGSPQDFIAAVHKFVPKTA